MQLIKSITVVIALLLSLQAKAQSNKTNTLPQLAKMFSGQWIGEGSQPEGGTFSSYLDFSLTLGDNFLEVQNRVESDGRKEHYATTYYAWHPVIGQLVFWALDKNGTINEGQAAIDKNSLKHEWRSFSKGGEIRDWRSSMTLDSPNRFTFTLMDGQGDVMVNIEYKRKE